MNRRRMLTRTLASLALAGTLPLPALGAGVTAKRSAALTVAPKRIVALEFMLAEYLLTLGITPVGMTDPALYPLLLGAHGEQLAQAVNVGSRQQPSLEAIARLKPDLILGVDYRHISLFSALEAIAPTVLFSLDPLELHDTQLGVMLRAFDTVAELSGRAAQAPAVKAALVDGLATERRRLEAAGAAGTRIAYMQELGPSDMYWLFTANSMAATLAARLGLSYRITQRTRDGVRYIKSEELLDWNDTDIALVGLGNRSGSAQEVLTSPVWRFVPARRDGRIMLHPINLWSFGGPVSALQLARQLADTVIGLRR
jgi:ABC-type Fe3+-hydroxamate transport system substrate-binding protein